MNINSYNKLLRDLDKIGDIVERESSKIETYYRKEARSTMAYIANSIIDQFYEDYEPHIYERWGDLYNTYKITINNTKWAIEYSPSFMKYEHDASNDYIFNLSFIMGYHGGAIDGPNHPQPGIPYYRTFPKYKTWSYAARRAKFSPRQEIETKVQKYLDSLYPEMNKKFQDVMTPYFEDLKQQIKKTFEKRRR